MCLLCKIFGGWGLAPSPESSSNLGIISIVQSGSLVRAKYMQNLQSTGEMVPATNNSVAYSSHNLLDEEERMSPVLWSPAAFQTWYIFSI